MKVLITGGTGFVGSYMTEGFTRLGHEVSVLTRSAKKGKRLPAGATFIEGDPQKPGPWQENVAQSDLVINLAGTSIFNFWTERVCRSMIESRVFTTRNVVDALAAHPSKAVLLSASAVGYYGSRADDLILDESGPLGMDFLAELSERWESEARRAEEFGVRVALCRFGIVLGRGGGALQMMAGPFKYYLGSVLGSGKQWFPWIHEEDLFRIMLFLAENSHIKGPVNCMAPNPIRNREMTRALARALHRFVLMPPVPAFVLKILLGELGDVLIKGQRAVPKRLLDEGFEFKFPTFEEAVRDLLG